MVEPASADARGKLKRATIVLLFAALIWGSMIPVLSVLAQHYDAWLLSWLRYVLGMPVLWIAVMFSTRPVLKLGAAMTVFSVLYTFGIAHSHPATAAIVLMCGPITATLLSRIMLGSTMPPGFLSTLALVVGGGLVVVLGTPGRAAGGLGLQGGEILLIAAQLCWNWYSIRAQRIAARSCCRH
jgi:drug/metabolite transporter (DMT)-like permease